MGLKSPSKQQSFAKIKKQPAYGYFERTLKFK